MFCAPAAMAEFARPSGSIRTHRLRATRMLQQRTRCLRRKLKRRRVSRMDVRRSAMIVMLVAAVGLLPCANAQTSGGEVLTLDEAISLARSNNRDLKQSGLEIGK